MSTDQRSKLNNKFCKLYSSKESAQKTTSKASQINWSTTQPQQVSQAPKERILTKNTKSLGFPETLTVLLRFLHDLD
jgi:hypothetical protein